MAQLFTRDGLRYTVVADVPYVRGPFEYHPWEQSMTYQTCAEMMEDIHRGVLVPVEEEEPNATGVLQNEP